MAPSESKKMPVVQRVITKTNATKKHISPSTTSALKKTMVNRKTIQETPLKDKTANIMETRQRVNSVPATPRPKETKPAQCPGSVTKSAKKAWKRRPKPAHSGVPVPDKMKLMLLKQLQDSDSSLELS